MEACSKAWKEWGGKPCGRAQSVAGDCKPQGNALGAGDQDAEPDGWRTLSVEPAIAAELRTLLV